MFNKIEVLRFPIKQLRLLRSSVQDKKYFEGFCTPQEASVVFLRFFV